MKTYTYYDNKNKGIKIFSCIALCILEADKLYSAELGIDCIKQAHVGCRVTF
jgi:hypothetical protein